MNGMSGANPSNVITLVNVSKNSSCRAKANLGSIHTSKAHSPRSHHEERNVSRITDKGGENWTTVIHRGKYIKNDTKRKVLEGKHSTIPDISEDK